ncbi:transcription-associated protein 1, partial [Dimargaris xerosporica]
EQRHRLSDTFIVEILQFTALIVAYAPYTMVEAKKTVILFAWNFIKQDDLTTKHAAYVLLARFIAAFETPSKICVQIYVALLRAHQTEVRNLVRQALDCMTPVLPQRLPATSGDGQLSTWIRWTKKILVEDGHSVSQMVNVYQLLIRHSDLFFDHCEQFFPHVVSALTKLGLLQSVTTEIRQLTIDLADLVLSWERKRLGVALPTSPPDAAMEVDLPSAHASSPHVPQKRPRPTDDESVASPTPAGKPKPSSAAPNHYAPPLFLRESVINYLVRFICYTNESSNRVGLIPRALVILKELLAPELWGDIQIRLSHFERSLLHSDITDSTLATVCHNLEVLTILVDRATPAWLGQQLSTLCQLLDKAVHSDNLAVVKALFPILGRLYSCLEQGGEAMDEDAVQTFKLTMDTIVNEGFQNTSNLFGALMILEVKGRAKAESLDPFIPALVKLVQKLTREHIDHPQTSTLSASGANVSTAAKKPLPTTVTPPGISHMVPTLVVDSPPDSPLNLLILTLNLLKVRISYLGDQRRWYLTSLISLMENSQSVELLTSILTIVSEWVLDPQNLFPTIKEKANLLVTMISVEKRQDRGLTEAYLQLVEKIYDDPAFARSELTVRLEQAFLLGTCFPNPALRDRFYAILNRSIPVTLPVRLSYVIHMQNWESLGSYFWIQQALIILLGAVITTHPLAAPTSAVRTPSITTLSPWLHADAMDTDPPVLPIHSPPTHAAESDGFAQLTTALMSFVYTLRSHTLQDVIVPFTQLIYLDDELAANLWKDLFPMYWACMTSKQRHDLTKSLTFLLIKPYHRLQAHARPNVIQTMLDGLLHCQPMPRLSPQLIKYLGKCFNAWHSALLILEKLLADTPPENPEDMEEDKVRGSMLDSLAELYWTLDEHDYFFGLWRRRASYMETNTALSYEQADVWDQAQAVYEKAQTRARKGGLPFTESEYCLWEDHWIRATQKLQQWDILMDLAKQDNNADLQLECAWRLWDWSVESPAVSQLLDACPERQSARHQLYQSFLLLIQAQKDKKIMDEFAKACNEGIQRSLQLWHALPANIGPAHTGHLHLFQLYVELQEAQQMYASLESTTATNVEAKSHELKTSLQTWRERLPNAWDDIQLWSDMVAWRQHMFTAINKTYLPLIPAITAKVGAGTNVNAGATSFAYRGYHETAWIINRFARVARKHKLLDVCVDSLKKIYTLPNIEIQEAFLKLKEQAECYYENPAEWTTGLDAINNTNLIYFNGTQKAEFFALKGMFLAKLQSPNEAKGAFSEAIQSDMASGQAWAAWGHFNDRMFRETPSNIVWGTHALSCYLHAAGIYKNAQSRRFIARILWLLSMDDTTGAMAKVFESYKGEMSVWYWNTFIPQLLTGLLQREAPICRQVLIHIAKLFPQAIHYHVRTAREEMLVLKRQAIMASSSAANDSSVPSNPTAAKDQPPPSPAESGGTPTKPAPDGASSGATAAAGSSDAGKPLQPWNHVEEIMRVLKTAFPLSGASIETMVEQIYNRLKPTTEEEIYRLLMALLNDAVQQLNLRLSHGVTNMTLTAATEANLKKFADNMTPPLLKEAFVRDFLTDKLTLDPYIERLRIWRDRFEYLIDRRPTRQPLERFSHYLVEFEYQKYDEIDVPGQYQILQSDAELVRIDRFLPEVTLVRGHGYCHRRIHIRGHNGVVYPFIVQQPLPRQSRREERMLQMFRIFDRMLDTQRESRRRELSFTLPIIVPFAPQLRIVQDDPTYFSLQEVYEDYARRQDFPRDAPISYYTEHLKHIDETHRHKNEYLNLKMDIIERIGTTYVPSVLLRDYVLRFTPTYADFWLFRKQFTSQLAAMTFMTYISSSGHRYPHKIHVSRGGGSVWTAEMVPTWTSQNPVFANIESVPFRLTPNLQTFIQPVGMEGGFVGSLVAIARSLVEPEDEMRDYLSIFIRDELHNWQTAHHKSLDQVALWEKVNQNIQAIMTKAEALSCQNDRARGADKVVPACQTVLDLMSHATNPEILARMDCIWMPWL